MMSLQEKWDAIYSQKEDQPSACFVLQEYQHLLPKRGVALDLACGQGGNALLLAEQGLAVNAWDLSAVALTQLEAFAQQQKLTISTQQRDVIESPPTANSLDVLVISFFLMRPLCPALYRALKPNGLLFYQTYCQQKVSDEGPRNPEYLLADNELLHLFPTMKVRAYREESRLGDPNLGLRNQVLLVAEKGKG